MSDTKTTVYQKLLKIQTELKAPKGQYNSFGKYKYRSCEDILESVKPLLDKHKATLLITDDIQVIGERYYCKATAKLIDIENGDVIEVSAFAREEESKKGMDGSQVTGASSSYARKYALNGLFAIDDTKDSDATNTGNLNYRNEFIRLCKEKGISPTEFANNNGITKETTQEEYKVICENLKKRS